MNQVQLACIRFTVDVVLTADTVVSSSVKVHLLEHVSVGESTASKRRFLVLGQVGR